MRHRSLVLKGHRKYLLFFGNQFAMRVTKTEVRVNLRTNVVDSGRLSAISRNRKRSFVRVSRSLKVNNTVAGLGVARFCNSIMSEIAKC